MHNIQYIGGGGASALLLAQLPPRSLSPPGYARLITLAGWRSAVSVRLTACSCCLLSRAQRSRSADLAVPAQAATPRGKRCVRRGAQGQCGCMPRLLPAVHALRQAALDLLLEWEPQLVRSPALLAAPQHALLTRCPQSQWWRGPWSPGHRQPAVGTRRQGKGAGSEHKTLMHVASRLGGSRSDGQSTESVAHRWACEHAWQGAPAGPYLAGDEHAGNLASGGVGLQAGQGGRGRQGSRLAKWSLVEQLHASPQGPT